MFKYSYLCVIFGSVATNVLRLKNVAKMQHQTITNIHKTLNKRTVPFQKIPKLAIFLNRC